MTEDEYFLAVVNRAQARIRKGWTQNAIARNIDGDIVDADRPDARCWCLSGALWSPDNVPGHQDKLNHLLLELAVGKDDSNDNSYRAVLRLVEWNDAPSRRHSEVLDLLNRAEERLVLRIRSGQPSQTIEG